jgi:hypothetical protein
VPTITAATDGLLADHGLFHPEADLHWIDTISARLDALRARVTGGTRPS